MKLENLEFISSLQRNPSNIRNICILAHVDHGKTTLADCLIASNGIISARLAGKLRYMDSREDEQLRGITMKSSAISLFYNQDNKNYLVNLIDSPGHIDFSSEVSTAVRLCDGALVVVDVIEGVCPQTNAVLRQAWLEGIKPCLVLNKIDRLITELKLSPLEAYYHLVKVLEQINAVTGTLFSTQFMQKSSTEKNTVDHEEQVFDWSSGLDEADDDNLYFSPAQGNVVFTSAIDGWGFSISTFASLYSEKLGISKVILMKTLWGDYFLNTKMKKIFKGAYTKGKKPLFVQFILQNIWDVYDAVLLNRNMEKIDKIVSSLNLKISIRDSKYTDTRIHLHAILRQWLPLSNSLLDVVCRSLPSPVDISEERVKNLMCGGIRKFESFPEETRKLSQDFLRCSTGKDAPVIVFVSKMFSVSSDMLPENKSRPLNQEEIKVRHEAAKQRMTQRLASQKNMEAEDKTTRGEIEKEASSEKRIGDEVVEKNNEDCVAENENFIAFARVFSGVLKKNSRLYVLGPKYDPSKKDDDVSSGEHVNKNDDVSSGEHVNNDPAFGDLFTGNHQSVCHIGDLYLMMGREFERFDEIPAGNIIGINGLGGHILKSATVSTSLACPPFTPMPLEAKPIVRVALEPKQPSQLSKLVTGMKLLNQADPCVEVRLQESGEYVIIASGEVHLQRCLDDLRERYAKIQIRVSDPIVPFRETVVPPPTVDMVNEEITDENKLTAHHTQRLPAYMLKEIQAFSDTIRKSDDQNVCEDLDKSNELSETMSKTQLSERRKNAKIKEKLGLIETNIANKQFCISLHAKRIPEEIVMCLEKNAKLLKIMQQIMNSNTLEERNDLLRNLTKDVKNKIVIFYTSLQKLFDSVGKLWKGCVDKIWAIGPKGVNSNLLINNIKSYDRPNIWYGLHDDISSENSKTYKDFDKSMVSGFQLAVQSGPMCEEPLMGVAFFVEDWKLNCDDNDSEMASYGPLSGQHISAMKEGCRRAMMAQPMRLMVAMYTCDIQATSEVLGKMYAVLGKREGKIIHEDLKEGSDIFEIQAELPVAESFGFAEEIRKKTSGLASPQLVFSKWSVLDIDPFWIPTTEEEYELYGEKADNENQALRYVNNVRKRKGLYVEKKTVEFAEKQRTLKKNK